MIPLNLPGSRHSWARLPEQKLPLIFMSFFIAIIANGLRDVNKRLPFLQWLFHLSVDCVYLRETRVSSCAECNSWFSPYGFLCVAHPGSVHSCDSVILYRPKFVSKISSFDSAERFVFVEFSWHDVFCPCLCVCPRS